MRQLQYIVFFAVTTIVWLVLIDYLMIGTSDNDELKKQESIIDGIGSDVKKYRVSREKLLWDITFAIQNNSQHSNEIENEAVLVNTSTFQLPKLRVPVNELTIAVVVIACDRVTVSRCLDQLVKYRESRMQFPIIVSQDCDSEKTLAAIDKFSSEIYHIHQPDRSDIIVPPREKKFKGYFKIARHYKWALSIAFNHYNFSNVIVVEDDLDISPDFYEYFKGTLPILSEDDSLWCVSAWNDNGKPEFVDKNASDLLYRSNFFPGLGWMLKKSLWIELEPKWPKSYWDDWMREPDQRKGRSCIRPELSRTKTFGKIGVSNGLFYDLHLKHMYLNRKFVRFSNVDLSYLKKEAYDAHFTNIVYGSPIVSLHELQLDKVVTKSSVRILYDSKEHLQKLCKSTGLMDDLKSGVPRTSYLGIVSFMYRNRRVFLTPTTPFNGYQ